MTGDRDDPGGSDGADGVSTPAEGTVDRENGLVVNERQTEKGLLVSVCDGDLIGRTFEEGEVSLTVSEEFYGGETLTDEETVESLSRASVANLVGVRAVELAVEAGYVEEANVLDVGDTRHAQFMRL